MNEMNELFPPLYERGDRGVQLMFLSIVNVFIKQIYGEQFMNVKSKPRKKRDILEEKLIKGTRLAVKKLIQERKKNNDYLIVSRRGKVVKIRARSIK